MLDGESAEYRHGIQVEAEEPERVFAGKPLSQAGVNVLTDRLGSVRWNSNGERFNYYPYGTERGTTANGREKFGTYFRDIDGTDYADQRYYVPSTGRFATPDPYQGSTGAEEPASWNRYSYVGGDPINRYDPNGTCWAFVTAGGSTSAEFYPCDSDFPRRIQERPDGIILEPQPLALGIDRRYAFSLAMQLQEGVSIYQKFGYNDCVALADFAEAAVANNATPQQIVDAFGVLTPGALSNLIPGIVWSSEPVGLNTGQPSGYADAYQNTLPDNKTTGWNGDQGHHFAAFFQAGFIYGANAAAYASFALEYWQGLGSGVMNLGDVRLGEEAGKLGAALKAGMTPEELPMMIRDRLCKH